MTKQEEIREGIRTAILENTQVNRHRGVVFKVNGLNNVLQYLHSQGVVIKVEYWLPTRDGMTCTIEPLIEVAE